MNPVSLRTGALGCAVCINEGYRHAQVQNVIVIGWVRLQIANLQPGPSLNPSYVCLFYYNIQIQLEIFPPLDAVQCRVGLIQHSRSAMCGFFCSSRVAQTTQSSESDPPVGALLCVGFFLVLESYMHQSSESDPPLGGLLCAGFVCHSQVILYLHMEDLLCAGSYLHDVPCA
jgi:hypothetical protein